MQVERILAAYPTLFGVGSSQPSDDLSHAGFGCEQGWLPIIARLAHDLTVIAQEDGLDQLRVFQVKQKFGGLRVYVCGGNDRVRARIDDAAREAARTCELCGDADATVVSLGGWYVTMCRQCKADEVAELRSRGW